MEKEIALHTWNAVVTTNAVLMQLVFLRRERIIALAGQFCTIDETSGATDSITALKSCSIEEEEEERRLHPTYSHEGLCQTDTATLDVHLIVSKGTPSVTNRLWDC
ncbi:unnamed protein product [Zymoseptoria tritici ST99CH_3D7]|uniref:Uncharacterized protein n=1 Tax=Zymoseptoria tritici (strain ST99CH_3D7) TaxID=1276538 RepID=A0A1X7S9D9_ZYMT9|nr:unnamed protein product [Zymoseptoria tritici ST99CH_3D7]